jgi:hypothetical protein
MTSNDLPSQRWRKSVPPYLPQVAAEISGARYGLHSIAQDAAKRSPGSTSVVDHSWSRRRSRIAGESRPVGAAALCCRSVPKGCGFPARWVCNGLSHVTSCDTRPCPCRLSLIGPLHTSKHFPVKPCLLSASLARVLAAWPTFDEAIRQSSWRWWRRPAYRSRNRATIIKDYRRCGGRCKRPRVVEVGHIFVASRRLGS